MWSYFPLLVLGVIPPKTKPWGWQMFEKNPKPDLFSSISWKIPLLKPWAVFWFRIICTKRDVARWRLEHEKKWKHLWTLKWATKKTLLVSIASGCLMMGSLYWFVIILYTHKQPSFFHCSNFILKNSWRASLDLHLRCLEKVPKSVIPNCGWMMTCHVRIRKKLP